MNINTVVEAVDDVSSSVFEELIINSSNNSMTFNVRDNAQEFTIIDLNTYKPTEEDFTGVSVDSLKMLEGKIKEAKDANANKLVLVVKN